MLDIVGGTDQADGAPRTVNIIVADDNATNRFVLKGFLKRLGFMAHIAVDGAEAVELALAERPTLVLMDIQMPRMDGIEAAITIRRKCSGARIPIIAVTAYGDSRHLKEFELAEFDELIVKPVSITDLQRTLAEYLGPANSGAEA